MKIRFILLSFLFFTITSLSAQQLEIFSGWHQSNLRDGRSSSNFSYDNGYVLGISYDNPNMNGIASRITLSYTNFEGGLYTSQTTDAGESISTVLIKNSDFNIAVYPFTFFAHDIYLSLGAQASFLLDRQSLGRQTNLIGSTISMERDINDIKDPDLHMDFTYGLAARLAYSFRIGNAISLTPQYNIYYGIGNEYATVESPDIKTWKQNLSFGVGFNFN